MRRRSVSLTGATGFVGWHLAEVFRDQGWQVRAVVRPGGGRALPPGVEPRGAGLEGALLARAFDGSELVVHCAGLIRARNDAAFDAVNVDGTRAVIDACNTIGARVVVISSLAAAGPGTHARPRRESDPVAPVNAYGRSKQRSEAVVRERARTPWTIVRPCAVYGPRDRGFLPLFKLARRGLFVLPAPAPMPFTLIDIADLSRAVVLAASSERAVGETFFVGHPEPQTTGTILGTLADVYQRRYVPYCLPRPIVRAAASIGDLAWRCGRSFVFDSRRLAEFEAEGFVCSVEHARSVLGFTANTSLADGFARTAAWYRAQGWI